MFEVGPVFSKSAATGTIKMGCNVVPLGVCAPSMCMCIMLHSWRCLERSPQILTSMISSVTEVEFPQDDQSDPGLDTWFKNKASL